MFHLGLQHEKTVKKSAEKLVVALFKTSDELAYPNYNTKHERTRLKDAYPIVYSTYNFHIRTYINYNIYYLCLFYCHYARLFSSAY